MRSLKTREIKKAWGTAARRIRSGIQKPHLRLSEKRERGLEKPKRPAVSEGAKPQGLHWEGAEELSLENCKDPQQEHLGVSHPHRTEGNKRKKKETDLKKSWDCKKARKQRTDFGLTVTEEKN